MPLPPVSSFLEPFRFLLAATPFVNRFLSTHDDFAPHPAAHFEGYYTRLLTDDGATILFIFSSVFTAVDKPHLVHFSYLPRDPKDPRRIVVNRFPHITDVWGSTHGNGVTEFSRVAEGDGVQGSYKIGRHEQRYRLELETKEYGLLEVEADLTDRTAWSRGNELSTPEGIFSKLTYLMPLHWNVLSTSSNASCTIKRNGDIFAQVTGMAHIEKNWGASFPTGWTWLQGFQKSAENTKTFAMAGGRTMGQKAYLLGYRSNKIDISFAPLWTLMPFGIPTPFAKDMVDSKNGQITFDVCSLSQRLVVEAQGPPHEDENWIGLHCPLSDGHGNTWAWESFVGTIKVKAYVRGLLGWKLVDEALFEDAAVEFGGEYRTS
ncbi:hypothetical protein EX30DRAFT_261901 [Ascodesmis nigricans]|uniref:Tocopherol cyclase n=1 Tax=Ascodesmis nigricans TaxID=341454 RepID=A0A4S2MXI3_9PEZI|nr:hypothetical protein EX30DRAFT_261901 [Ascodesmis nigricans]